MKKFRFIILNNFWLKIAAVVASSILWLLVTNYNNPVTYVQFNNIPVTIQNTKLITDQGNVYTVLDGTDVVSVVTVRASRSVADALDAGNIQATADVADITSENTIEIHLSSNKNNNEILNMDGSISNVKLSIEKRKSATLSLKVTSAGEPAAGYVLSDITPEQNQIRISGPESIVSEVKSAAATVDVSGAMASISTFADVHLYDEDEVEIDRTKLTMNVTSVKVSAAVYPTKEVPFQVTIDGSAASGYVQSGKIESDPATVRIAGRSSAINSVEYITIPSGRVDITGKNENVTVEVDIEDFLPDNVFLPDSEDKTVRFTVEIEPLSVASVPVGFDEVTLENLPEGLNARILTISDGQQSAGAASEDKTLHLSVTGPSGELETLTSAEMMPHADVSEAAADYLEAQKKGDVDGTAKTGTDDEKESESRVYTVPITVTLPQHTTARNTLAARISISAADESRQDEETESADGQ